MKRDRRERRAFSGAVSLAASRCLSTRAAAVELESRCSVAPEHTSFRDLNEEHSLRIDIVSPGECRQVLPREPGQRDGCRSGGVGGGE